MPSRSPGWLGFTRPWISSRCVPSQLLDDACGGLSLLDGERLALAGRRHEREHHQIGVGVHEHVLHELVRPDAVQVVAVAGAAMRLATAAIGGELQRLRRRRQGLQPRAGGIHEVTLHVEDELVAVHCRARGKPVERCLARHLVEAARAARGRVRRIETRERAGDSARRDEKAPAVHAQPPGSCRRFFQRETIGMPMHRFQRDRGELAVGRGIELDREPQAFRVVTVFHVSPCFPGS